LILLAPYWRMADRRAAILPSRTTSA
jgi:hypothetical protein